MAAPHEYLGKEQHDEGWNYTPARRKKIFSYTQALIIILLTFQSLFIIKLWTTKYTCLTTTSSNEGFIMRRWHRNTSYMSLDHMYDHLWNETGQSALVFDNDKNVVQLTMIHQLHCLSSLRSALQNAKEGLEIGIDEKDNSHWPHCFQYLREAILCTADGSLEHHSPNHSIISGYLDMRSCRSAEAVFEYRDERKIYNYDGSLISATPWQNQN